MKSVVVVRGARDAATTAPLVDNLGSYNVRTQPVVRPPQPTNIWLMRACHCREEAAVAPRRLTSCARVCKDTSKKNGHQSHLHGNSTAIYGHFSTLFQRGCIHHNQRAAAVFGFCRCARQDVSLVRAIAALHTTALTRFQALNNLLFRRRPLAEAGQWYCMPEC